MDFKQEFDLVTKEILEKLDISNYFINLVENYPGEVVVRGKDVYILGWAKEAIYNDLRRIIEKYTDSVPTKFYFDNVQFIPDDKLYGLIGFRAFPIRYLEIILKYKRSFRRDIKATIRVELDVLRDGGENIEDISTS